MLFETFFDLYKEYNNCLISFLSFSELFPAINWAKEIGNPLSIWFGVSIFKPPPQFSSVKLRICSTISIILLFSSILFALSLGVFSESFFKLVNALFIDSV